MKSLVMLVATLLTASTGFAGLYEDRAAEAADRDYAKWVGNITTAFSRESAREKARVLRFVKNHRGAVGGIHCNVSERQCYTDTDGKTNVCDATSSRILEISQIPTGQAISIDECSVELRNHWACKLKLGSASCYDGAAHLLNLRY